MKIFNSFNEFAQKTNSIKINNASPLNQVLKKTLINIKKRFGVYPSDISWQNLLPSTISRKVTGDSPLLETGKTRDSYKIKSSSPVSGEVTSNYYLAAIHEFGTIGSRSNIPARPVAVPEAEKAKIYAKEIFEKELLEQLSNNFK